MAYNVVQVASGQTLAFTFDQTTVATEALSQTVTPGNALVAFVQYGSEYSSPHVIQIAGGGDGVAWVPVQSYEVFVGGVRWTHMFYALDVPGEDDDPFVATFTPDIGQTGDVSLPAICVVEVSGVESADALIAFAFGGQATPGGSANAVTTDALNVTAQPAALIALSYCPEGAPNAGTGFTDAAGVWAYGGVIPEARVEHRQVTATGNTAATFTATQGSEPHYAAALALLEASESEPQEADGTGSFAGGDLEVSMSGVGLVSDAPAQEVSGTGTFSVELAGATFDGLGQSASRKLVLSEADGTEFRNELQLPVTKSNIPFEWYDKWGNTTGEPVVSGVFSLNDGEAIIPLFGTSLSSTQEGTLIAYDSDFGGIYKLAVT